MTKNAPSGKRAPRSAPSPVDVESFFAALDHPHGAELRALRQLILDADPSISEGIKWNVPSFRTTEYFATLHLRAKRGVGVILHFGAKKRDDVAARAAIADPSSLLEWLAEDRAMATFLDLKDVEARRAAFTEILRQWIKHV